MLTSILMAFIGAIGIFLVVLSLAWKRVPNSFERIKLLTSQHEALHEAPPEPGDSLLKTFRKKGLAASIAQADLPVTPMEFLRTGIAIAGFLYSRLHHDRHDRRVDLSQPYQFHPVYPMAVPASRTPSGSNTKRR